jgi:exopolysaccharide biosynthesis polyprenyl glycosylphosphotransferase
VIDPGTSWARAGARPARGFRLRLPLNIAERRLLLLGVDAVAVNAALVTALAIRARHAPDPGLPAAHAGWFVILTAIWIAVAYALDVYEPRGTGRHEAPAVLRAALLTSLFYLLVPRYTPALPTSRLALVSFPLLVVVALLAGRRLFAWALPRPVYERKALVIGAGRAGRTVAQALLQDPQAGVDVLGFIDDDPAKAGAEVPLGSGENGPAGAPAPAGGTPRPVAVLGNRERIKDLAGALQVSTLILAITGDVDSDLLEILMDCAEQGVEIVPMPVIYEQVTGRVPVEHVGEKWYAAIPVHPRPTAAFWEIIKRTMDIGLAVLGLGCLAPLAPVIALAILLDSGRPVLYLQERVGKGGRVFRALKFRSMVRGAEQNGAVWAREHDPRVTRVGRILRAAHLDEWPQFVNVLRGEMSIVGPRPERPEFVEALAARIPIYRLRHTVKPGMGGWGLVRQGYAASPEDAVLRLQYDLYYIKHRSLWLDLVIILRTIVHAVMLKGR